MDVVDLTERIRNDLKERYPDQVSLPVVEARPPARISVSHATPDQLQYIREFVLSCQQASIGDSFEMLYTPVNTDAEAAADRLRTELERRGSAEHITVTVDRRTNRIGVWGASHAEVAWIKRFLEGIDAAANGAAPGD
jgi:hypothetical protein